MRLAREISNREIDTDEFPERAESLINRHPELQGLTWMDERRRVKASYGTARLGANPLHPASANSKADETHNSTFGLARDLLQPIYAQPTVAAEAPGILQLHIPLTLRARFAGVLLAEYSLDGLFRYGVPSEVSAR